MCSLLFLIGLLALLFVLPNKPSTVSFILGAILYLDWSNLSHFFNFFVMFVYLLLKITKIKTNKKYLFENILERKFAKLLSAEIALLSIFSCYSTDWLFIPSICLQKKVKLFRTQKKTNHLNSVNAIQDTKISNNKLGRIQKYLPWRLISTSQLTYLW